MEFEKTKNYFIKSLNKSSLSKNKLFNARIHIYILIYITNKLHLLNFDETVMD